MSNEQTTIKRFRESLESNKNILESNKQHLKNFIAEKEEQGKRQPTLKNYWQVLYYFLEWVGMRRLEDVCISKEAMLEYFRQITKKKLVVVHAKTGLFVEMRELGTPLQPTTKHLYEVRLKTFIKWLLNLGKHEVPASMAWISKPETTGIEKKDLLEANEVQSIINSCDNLRDKAIIQALYESMCRASEFLQWNVGSIEIQEDYAQINVVGKGGIKYTAFIVNALPAVRQWLEAHPRKTEPEAPLWCSFNRKTYGNRLTKTALNAIVKKLAKRAGIKKRVYNHLFRHSGITAKIKAGYNEPALKLMVGHKAGSNVLAAVYSHLASEDAAEEIKRMHGLKGAKYTVPQLERITCPRCKTIWPPGQKFCTCNYIFDAEEIQKKERSEVERIKVAVNEALNDALKSKGIKAKC